MANNYNNSRIRLNFHDNQIHRIPRVDNSFIMFSTFNNNILNRRTNQIFDRFFNHYRGLSPIEEKNSTFDQFQMLDVMSNLFNRNGIYDIMEERMMEAATRESLSYYKTQEKKPNIKLNIENQQALPEHKSEQCAICKENFEVEDNITHLECRHILHTDCISEWVQYKSECPVCRGEIKTIDTSEKHEESN